MPSNEASPLSRWKGPCIISTREEHYKTCSHSRVKGSKKYRQKQKELIKNGRFLDAEIMDIIDILERTKDKYLSAIAQKIEYDIKLYEKGKINE